MLILINFVPTTPRYVFVPSIVFLYALMIVHRYLVGGGTYRIATTDYCCRVYFSIDYSLNAKLACYVVFICFVMCYVMFN